MILYILGSVGFVGLASYCYKNKTKLLYNLMYSFSSIQMLFNNVNYTPIKRFNKLNIVMLIVWMM